MLIECLIEREGPTNVSVNKTKYQFFSTQPGGPCVCEVSDPEHIKWFLAHPNLYREFSAKKERKAA